MTAGRVFRRNTLAGAALALLLFAVATFDTPPAHAAVSPPVTIVSVTGHRLIVDDSSGGDLFFLISYDLPVASWCAELTDTTGCSASPIAPTAPTSLANGAVVVRFLDDVGGIRYEANAPRIDHALAGIRLDVGHGLTWGNSSYQACIVSSATVYTPNIASCTPVTWSTSSATQDAQRSDLGSTTIARLVELQQDRAQAIGTYVSAVGLITVDGQVFTREALGVMDRIIPEIFETGSSPIFTEDITPSTGTVLGDSLAVGATSSGIAGVLTGIGNEWAIAGTELGSYFVFLIAAIVAIIATAIVRDAGPMPAAMAFMSVLIFGSFMGAPGIEVVLTIAFVLSIPTVAWVVARIKP